MHKCSSLCFWWWNGNNSLCHIVFHKGLLHSLPHLVLLNNKINLALFSSFKAEAINSQESNHVVHDKVVWKSMFLSIYSFFLGHFLLLCTNICYSVFKYAELIYYLFVVVVKLLLGYSLNQIQQCSGILLPLCTGNYMWTGYCLGFNPLIKDSVFNI